MQENILLDQALLYNLYKIKLFRYRENFNLKFVLKWQKWPARPWQTNERYGQSGMVNTQDSE
jgi:hypothetical protein